MDTRLKKGYLIISNRKYPVFEGLNLIGRNKQSTVVLIDHTVSHQQAAIVIVNDKHYVCDMDSCNGTLLEEAKLHPFELYEVDNEKKISFSNVEAVYKYFHHGETYLQEVGQLSEIDVEVFLQPTQQLNASDVTNGSPSKVGIRAKSDRMHLDNSEALRSNENSQTSKSSTTDNTEQTDEMAQIVHDNNAEKTYSNAKIHDLPTQHRSHMDKKKFCINSAVHDLPTQISNFNKAKSSNHKLKIYKDTRKRSDNENNLLDDDSVAVDVDVNELPTQLFNPEIDTFSNKVNEENLICNERSLGVQEKCTTFHDLPTQIYSNESAQKLQIYDQPTQFFEHYKKLPSPIYQQAEISDNGQIVSPGFSSSADEGLSAIEYKEPLAESYIIEESIVETDIGNENEIDVNEDSNSSVDYLKVINTSPQSCSQSQETSQVVQFQRRVRNVILSNDENGSNKSHSMESNDANLPCSLKINYLRPRIRNVIASDDEGVVVAKGDLSDETDVEIDTNTRNMVSVGNEDTTNSTLIKASRSGISSNKDRQGKSTRKKRLKKKIYLSNPDADTDSDTDVENKDKSTRKKKPVMHEDANNTNVKKLDDYNATDIDVSSQKEKLCNKSNLEFEEADNLQNDDDTDIEEILVKNNSTFDNTDLVPCTQGCHPIIESVPSQTFETCQKKSQDHPNTLNNNSTLNDSDVVAATQDCQPEVQTIIAQNFGNGEKRSQNPLTSNCESQNYEESVDCSLNLVLSESMDIIKSPVDKNLCASSSEFNNSSNETQVEICSFSDEDIQRGSSNTKKYTAKSRGTCSENKMHPEGPLSTENSEEITKRTVDEFKCDESASVRPAISSRLEYQDKNNDDIFLQATQLIYLDKTEKETNEDVFLQPTQSLLLNMETISKNPLPTEKLSNVNEGTTDGLKCNEGTSVRLTALSSISRAMEQQDVDEVDIHVQVKQHILYNNKIESQKDQDISLQATEPLSPSIMKELDNVKKNIVLVRNSKENEKDDIFLIPTQSICTSRTPREIDQNNEDDVFIQLTQPISDNETVVYQCNEREDIFLQPTQKIPEDSSNTQAVVDNNNDDIFLQATQPTEICNTFGFRKPDLGTIRITAKSIRDKTSKLQKCQLPVIQILDDTDEFSVNTPAPKKNSNNIDDKLASQKHMNIFTNRESDEDIFSEPTQKIEQLASNIHDKPTAEIPTTSVESQLEILFASQGTVQLPRGEYRPQNPLANILENLQSQNSILVLPENDASQENIDHQIEIEISNNKACNTNMKGNKGKSKQKGCEEIETNDKSKNCTRSKKKEKHEKNEHVNEKDAEGDGRKSPRNKQKKDVKSGKRKHEIEFDGKTHKSDNDREVIDILETGKDEKCRSRRKSNSNSPTEIAVIEIVKNVNPDLGQSRRKQTTGNSTEGNDLIEEKSESKRKSKRIRARSGAPLENENRAFESTPNDDFSSERNLKKSGIFDILNLDKESSEKVREKLSTCRENYPHGDTKQHETENCVNGMSPRSKSNSPFEETLKLRTSKRTRAHGESPLREEAKSEKREGKDKTHLQCLDIRTGTNQGNFSSNTNYELGDPTRKSKRSRTVNTLSRKKESDFTKPELDELNKNNKRTHSSSPIEKSPAVDVKDNMKSSHKEIHKVAKEDLHHSVEAYDGKTPKRRNKRILYTPEMEFHGINELAMSTPKCTASDGHGSRGNTPELSTEPSMERPKQARRSSKRSHGTQESNSPACQEVGCKSSEDTVEEWPKHKELTREDPNDSFENNTDLIQYSDRRHKSKNSIAKSTKKECKMETELSLIEEVSEYSEKTNVTVFVDRDEKTTKRRTGRHKKEVKAEVKINEPSSKDTLKLEDINAGPSCSNTEFEYLNITKRSTQKHRRHSTNSDDDFIITPIRKRSRLNSTQSSNISESTFSSSTTTGPVTSERPKREIKPKVVFTMMDSPELESLIRRLGGSVVDSVNTCTVLVTASIKRSQKLLTAIGQGKPICSPNWLDCCKKANKFLDPWDHILKDDEAEAKWNFSLCESLNRSTNKKLLENYSVLIQVNAAQDVLKGAIESCGGKCVPRVAKSESGYFVIISSEENKSKCARYLKQNPRSIVVAAEAIFDGVLRQELHFDEHLLV